MWMDGVVGVSVKTWEIAREGVDGWGKVGGDGWKCGGGWEARDRWNMVGRDLGKVKFMPGATPDIYGGKKEVVGQIVTLTCLCTRTCIHIDGLVY